MAYQLIAVDMDGTLLNSKKEITPRTAAAVTQALARGYHVVMATGRCYRQIAPYMRQFPAMRYAITSSGAAVADCAQDRIISAQDLPADVAAELVRAFEGLDGFPIIFSNGEAIYRPELLNDPQHFGMDAYVDNFKSHCTACEMMEQRFLPVAAAGRHDDVIPARERSGDGGLRARCDLLIGIKQCAVHIDGDELICHEKFLSAQFHSVYCTHFDPMCQPSAQDLNRRRKAAIIGSNR